MRAQTAIKIFAVLSSLLFTFAVFMYAVLTRQSPISHAVFGMVLGLYVFWVIGFGFISWKFKGHIREFILKIPGHWALKFVVFCTMLALAEEAITTSMTNLAPWWGVPIGKAYITASSSYLNVVLGHSVIMFVPIFMAWAWILSRYDFKPNQVLLLFGLTGTIMETIFAGPQGILEIGMWMFVYGLMVYLPAYSLPERKVRPVRPYHYLLPFILAVLFQAIQIPVTPIVRHFLPSAAQSFPPIQADLPAVK